MANLTASYEIDMVHATYVNAIVAHSDEWTVGDIEAAYELLFEAGVAVDLFHDDTIAVCFEPAIRGWVDMVVADLG